MQNTITFISPSNFANFRLGPIDGSGCDTLGINSVEALEKPKADISVYPNPAKELLNIRLLNTIPKKPNIYIFNSLGALIYQGKFENVIHVLKLSDLNLSKGLYWMKIMNGNDSFVKRFVVE